MPDRNNTSRESVWDYPRHPVVELVPQPVKVIFNGEVIASSNIVKRVLEKGHPPVCYIPLEDVKKHSLRDSSRRTWCEWKGEAFYFHVVVGDRISNNAAWYYPKPTPDFVEIKNYLAFYAAKMDACYLGGEIVKPQAGDFYGGWITNNIEGPFKDSSMERYKYHHEK